MCTLGGREQGNARNGNQAWNENTRESWSAVDTHRLEELMALNHPAGPVRPWEVRVRAEVVVKEEEDGSGVGSLWNTPFQRCQDPALLLLTAPWELTQHHHQSLGALLLPAWRCHTDTSDTTHTVCNSSFGVPSPGTKPCRTNPHIPRKLGFAGALPASSGSAKALCKSTPHLLFHLNDLPSLAGLSLSRACIQGNESYRGKNGSKKLLKSQYPF